MTDVQDSVESPSSSCAVIICIITVIFAMSAAFFWAGNVFYGVVMIGLPVISIAVSFACYVAHKQHPSLGQAVTDEVQLRAPEEQERSPFADQPPAYRMTWRRSFMKKMKQLRPITNGNNGSIEPENANSPEAVELTEVIVDQSDQSKQENDADDSIKMETEEGIRPIGLANPNPPMNEELPSYDEALEIIASREDLTS